MSGNVKAFAPTIVGDGFRFNGDDILEQAKGRDWRRLVVLGETEAGELYVAGNANAGESLVLMKKAERLVVFGES